MSHADLLKRHREEIRAIVEAHGASNPRVFGSVRYGVDTPESDIDLLVDPEPERSRFDPAGMQEEIRELLGVEVDVLTPGGLQEGMRDRVLADAQPVVEGDYGYGGTASMRDKSVRLPGYIEDILKAIDRVERYLTNQTRASFMDSDSGLLQDAVILRIAFIGEASANIRRNAPAFHDAHPELPFQQANAMRNRVIHGYADIDLNIVWKVATEDLPRLKERLLAIRQAEGLGDG